VDRKAVNKLLYHVRRLVDLSAPDLEHHWTQCVALCEALLAQPCATSEHGLRARIAVLQASCAARALPGGYVVLVRELEAAAARGAPAAADAQRAPTDVERVAELLRGRAIVVIGGLPRQEHARHIEQAFGLSEAVWLLSREHNPDVDGLEPAIARPDVALVLLLIRWIRHALGEVATLCERHGKPMARIPGGYNVETLAPQILSQCGKRLGAQ
jgi:hypothetical protein